LVLQRLWAGKVALGRQRGDDPQVDAIIDALIAAERRARKAGIVADLRATVPSSRSGSDTPSSPDGLLLLTAREVARLLGVSKRYVTELATDGDLKARMVGGRWLFDEAEVHRYVKEREST